MAYLTAGVKNRTKFLSTMAILTLASVTLFSAMDTAVACRPGMDPTGEQCDGR